ncbi:rod shape-determining protein MreC [Monashia sp. NPDC004114]
MNATAQRRLLVVLVCATVALLAADLAGSGVARGVREAAGVVLGPVQRALSGAPPDDLAGLEAENVRLRAVLADQANRLDELAGMSELLDASTTSGHSVVAARVVATSVSVLGGRGVTIDAGSRDGIQVDSTVVSSEGLVGRVVSAAPWTSDVQVLGSGGSVVGVRTGPAGTLGTVSTPRPGDRDPRPRGTLTLTFVQPGTPVVGDDVRTLGSTNGSPYAAGILVGTVTAVDPDRGQLTRTATVRPAIDADAIDLVAVLVPGPRTQPRSPSTAPSDGAMP